MTLDRDRDAECDEFPDSGAIGWFPLPAGPRPRFTEVGSGMVLGSLDTPVTLVRSFGGCLLCSWNWLFRGVMKLVRKFKLKVIQVDDRNVF